MKNILNKFKLRFDICLPENFKTRKDKPLKRVVKTRSLNFF